MLRPTRPTSSFRLVGDEAGEKLAPASPLLTVSRSEQYEGVQNLKYEHPNVAYFASASDLICGIGLDKPSCNFLDNAIVILIFWTTGSAYQADE